MVLDANEEKTRIEVAVILEVLGKPAEHLTETLDKIVKEINEETGIKVVESKIHEPKEMEKHKGMFTSFADLMIEVDSLDWLIVLMFKYMPAHVEVISPERVTLGNQTWNSFLNSLARKLHGYDEVARVLQAEKKVLERQLKALMEKEK